MSAKFRNKIKRVLYRPAKKRPHMDYVAKQLDDAENALSATIGGIFKNKKPARSGANEKEKADEKNDEKK